MDEFPKLKVEFCKTHHDNNDKPINVDGMKIQTQLKAVIPTSENESSYVVYIWKVDRSYCLRKRNKRVNLGAELTKVM